MLSAAARSAAVAGDGAVHLQGCHGFVCYTTRTQPVFKPMTGSMGVSMAEPSARVTAMMLCIGFQYLAVLLFATAICSDALTGHFVCLLWADIVSPVRLCSLLERWVRSSTCMPLVEAYVECRVCTCPLHC